jgi:hypothetical protein
MHQAVVRVFDEFELAQQARQALLEQGFAAAAVDMRIANDEAGAVRSNFTVGNGPTDSTHHTDGGNDAKPALSGHCVMTVATADAAEAGRAVVILARFGARDVGAVTP